VKPHRFFSLLDALDPVERRGKLKRIMPTWLEADGPNVPLGTLCTISGTKGGADTTTQVIAEVVKVDNDHIALVPFGDTSLLTAGSSVTALSGDARVPVGDAFMGRAIDALGKPIDNAGAIHNLEYAPLHTPPPEPLERTSPKQVLNSGMRAIDGLLTLGIGQRVGIFAASGVGKTSMISQLSRQITADHVVICLVGERGREVEHLWSEEMPKEIRQYTTVVAATSDKAAALRVRAVYQALALAQHWRAQGRHVLFILDSITRLAMAMRETGLAAGEPPTVRAYTPSVFAAIPRVVEQCGALRSGGAITALMTVLSETDEIDDPISEMMKSLLDGHIILSRTLAERGHFPAIDVSRSISRNMSAITSKSHLSSARKILAHLANYEGSRTLIESGLYSGGASTELDAAIAAKPVIDSYLQQDQYATVPFTKSTETLIQIAEIRHEPFAKES
jgi:flagellum-specific ATP synthase